MAQSLNPFLFEADYGGIGDTSGGMTAAAAAAAAANPFLSDFDSHVSTSADMMCGVGAVVTAVTAADINPFLSYQPEATYTTMTHETGIMSTAGGGGATNPFASFADPVMDLGMGSTQASIMNSVVDTTQQSTGGALFSTAPSAIDQGMSLFGGGDESSSSVAVEQLLDMTDEPVRPPPASVPSSTKDLLETVTGALEATSDSLLDRLRATQPSPVPQVIQPSPSPRSPSPDLLMGDEPPPPPPPSANPLHPSPGLNQVDSIMDMFDTPKSTSGPKSAQEIMGLYNSTTTTTTTTAATTVPSKAESLLDLLDSVPPSVSPPAEPFKQPQENQIISTETATTGLATATTPEQTTTVEDQKPTQVEDVPLVKKQEIEPVKVAPQPMRPPPPAPAPKQPPERPKLPPPVQHPVAPTPQPPTPPSPPPPQPINVEEIKAPEPVAAAVVVPEQRSPLPSRPPPPVPPAPRASPQPPQTNSMEHIMHTSPKITSPSPPTMTPSPTKAPPPVPPQPSAPILPQPSVPIPTQPSVPAAPVAVPVAAPFFEPSAAATSITDSSPLFSSNAVSSSPFGATQSSTILNETFFNTPAAPPLVTPKPAPVTFAAASAKMGDSFDAFEAKFSRAANVEVVSSSFDAFGGAMPDTTASSTTDSAWGDDGIGGGGFGSSDTGGFGTDGFDNFLSLTEPPPVPQSTPAKRSQAGDDDDDFEAAEDKDMSIVIKPRADKDFTLALAPALAPPPKSPAMSTGSAFSDENTAFVPFLSSAKDTTKPGSRELPVGATMHKSDSQDSPQTPLFEEDQSQPLEDFPRITYEGEGWEMHMRLPNKKKITGQRFWKKVFVKVGYQNEVPAVLIYNNKGEKDPFQEIPLQPCYSVSEISAQQFDQYGKVFTIKLQYIFYKERPGVRPGQISKASRISDKLSQFAAYAIQGDYAGVKEFGSDLKKLGAPIEHSPQISQLVKLGVPNFEDVKQFSTWIEENLFRMSVHRDRAINYKTEEIQVTIVDEYYVEQDIYGVVTRQIARVRLFFLSFLNGVAEVEMGVNDLRRQGKEIVGRHDIIPVPTEEWIRMEAIEFSNCVQLDEFDKTQTIKFKPPDACYIELMRFRVRPPRHRELPLQVKTVFTILGQRIDIRSDILVPGFTSRKLGQIPCEDVMVRFPIPEEWIYMFRVEKHFRYGSVKSAHRRSGKVKGIERFLGAVEAVEQSLMETTSGQAKYEHHHKAIVWRIPRLPKEGQGAYTTHSFFCHITLQAHERIPENLSKHCFVEFTMPHTTISHTVCRSISVPSCDEPPEKCCRYLSRHEYVVEVEHTQGVTPATYTAAAEVKKEEPPPPPPEEPMPGKALSDSDFSDDD